MAFALIDNAQEKSFAFTQRTTKTVEDMFAKGYRSQSFKNVYVDGQEKEEFLGEFFCETQQAERFLCELVIDNRLKYTSDEIEVIKQAKELLTQGMTEFLVVVDEAIDFLLAQLTSKEEYSFDDAAVVSVL